MSKKIFTEQEVRILSLNECVKNVSTKLITYTDEFKRIFIEEYESGKLPTDIFIENGFDINMLGIERVSSSAKRWLKSYRNKGIEGLSDARKKYPGKLKESELSIEEKYERLKAENMLLKAENELIKKLEMMERRLRSNR